MTAGGALAFARGRHLFQIVRTRDGYVGTRDGFVVARAKSGGEVVRAMLTGDSGPQVFGGRPTN